MDFHKYQEQACSTFKPHDDLGTTEAEIVDWTMGMCSEVGELVGLLKHSLFHKQPASKMEVAKEAGDLLWYLSALCTSLGINLADCAELNLAKLGHRHGKGFSFQGSHNRKELEEKFESTETYRRLKERIE